MDPLSITASVIAISTLATQITTAFKDLRALCKSLPGRLHALNNEVTDLEVVLGQLASLVRERDCLRITTEQLESLPFLLKQAGDKLTALKTLVAEIATSVDRAKTPILQSFVWRKRQEQLLALQEDIIGIKRNLNIVIGASNSRDLVRIQLDLQALSVITAQSASDQQQHRDDSLRNFAQLRDSFTDSLVLANQQFDARVARVEEMLETQSDRFEASKSMQIGPFYNAPRALRRRTAANKKIQQELPKVAHSEGVGVRVNRYATACPRNCPCVCHSPIKTATPKFIDRVLGQLFVGYAGFPVFSPKCNSEICQKSQEPSMSAEYWFPLGFCWSQIVRLEIGYRSASGPQLQLRTLRRVPDSAKCVTYALDGNIDGLKNLFAKGLASPQDVSSTRGYSLLRWALYGKQYETCQFLVYAGADLDYRPLADHDNSPRNKASDIVLQGGLSEYDVETLGCLTKGTDFNDDQEFTILHKIVIGLSLLDLEEQILLHRDQLNTMDAMGRTPLLWAAARGDSKAVSILLGFSADPNLMDIQRAGPVSYAADRGHAICVRLLLEAGADPDPLIPLGLKVGSPLNCAARNASDPLVLKNLLDFGADIEASNVDGKTSLHHVARTDNISFALILLNYGADINATTITGETPLTVAITFNSHNILQLLLDRWSEYSSCPRLKGPNLLQIAAAHADMETLSILTDTDHFKLKFDRQYGIGDFVTRLKERTDMDEKMLRAFNDLLDVIKSEPPSKQNSEVFLESGLTLKIQDNLEEPSQAEEHKDDGDLLAI